MKKSNVVILVILMLIGCSKHAEPPVPPRPALVMRVGVGEDGKAMVLVGEVKSRYESNQGFRISGKIVERKVEVGATVKKGQVLARLDAVDANLNVDSALADVRAAEASYELAKAEVERQRKLVEKKFISQSALDLKEADLKTTAAKVEQAKARAATTGNQSRYTTLVADRDGVVTQIHAEPGQVVQAGEIVAQIADTKQKEVLVSVPESRMKTIKVGDKVGVKLWADREKTYPGAVREIAPAANSATRTFDLRISILDADEAVRLGMTAGVKFAEDTDKVIVVPMNALTQINGKNVVWVIDQQGIANPREVTTGAYSETGVVVSNGLAQGEMIAIAGVHTLTKGQKVQPKFGVAS
jgi:membrane fusion protein, multidrug efflux system